MRSRICVFIFLKSVKLYVDSLLQCMVVFSYLDLLLRNRGTVSGFKNRVLANLNLMSYPVFLVHGSLSSADSLDCIDYGYMYWKHAGSQKSSSVVSSCVPQRTTIGQRTKAECQNRMHQFVLSFLLEFPPYFESIEIALLTTAWRSLQPQ